MTLLELLRLLKKHLAFVIALPVVCALVTAAVTWIAIPSTYVATASVYVVMTQDGGQSSQNSTNADLAAYQLMANDIAKLARTNNVQKQAAQLLGMQNLSDYYINVGSATNTRMIDISVTGTDPNKVAEVANALASALANVSQEVMDAVSVLVVATAEVPTGASGPKRLTYALAAFLAGLLVAIAIIVFIDMVDTRIRKPEEASELLGLPVIGRIPRVKR